uniref:Tryptophan synthase alpha chain n=1 Tax=Thaumatella adunca TaxID=2006976 RepID=A0A1Z1MNM5_9FLOR|nr:Tryptophan synthase alpha subunit [Thaumatella adunca]ARW67385.1 Tryptophan synthase alpha subunit [Thaumatella adunca]
MNSISQILQKKRNNGTCALVPFLTAGYPSVNVTIKALFNLDLQGADVIELGIPYSDALADGPLIQQASKVALQNHVYIDQVLSILSDVESKLSAPIVIFTYYNPILVRGIDVFIKEISNLGVKGLIVPDLPIEETSYITYLCNQYSIELILFIAPTSSRSRILDIADRSPGCVYLVSNTGVTGIRSHINTDIINISNYIKKNTKKFLMLGFGISSSSQVSSVSMWDIDGIVIGSAFTRILASGFSDSKIIENLGNFCSEMKNAIIY